MNRNWMLLSINAFSGLASQTLGADISLTPSASTIAQGGNITFTATVAPAIYVQEVEFTYEGESGIDVSTNSPFVATHTFNSPADGIVVTATVIYSNGDPAAQATVAVNVVGLALTGSFSPQRSWSCTYTVQSNPSGKSLNQIEWSYSWAGGANTCQNSTSWSGKMVGNGTLTVNAMVDGVSCQVSRQVVIAARSWPTPISCAEDNDPDYGDLPTPDAELGDNRELDSHCRFYFFGPRNSATDFAPARSLSQISTGPCAGLWYVSACILRCERETVVNRYIKEDGPRLDDCNFYNANESCFSTSAGAFVQAVKNHEYRGTPATPKSWDGHQGRIELAIMDHGYDAKQAIETLTNMNPATLSSEINQAILAAELDISDYSFDEWDMGFAGPNWGGEDSLGLGQSSRIDETGVEWSACNNNPARF